MRIGVIVLAAVIVALLALVAFRVATRVPPIPTGSTATGDLIVGSCLAESQTDLDEYTVVPCGVEHPQQVFATADLALDDSLYTEVSSALQAFGDEVCERYLEYRLFLVADLEKTEYAASAIDVPDPEAYAAGNTDALCVIAHEDGDTLTSDLYRPMP
jgi:hypothetical protein